MILACTAHREDRLPRHNFMLVTSIKEFFENNPQYTDVWTGGQLGGDTYCSFAAWSYDRNLHLCLPFPPKIFTSRWENRSDRDRLGKLMKAAKTVHFISQRYSTQAYLDRNRFMVDQADEVFAIWDGKQYGGTYYTVQYAREVGRPLIVLDPNTLALRREDND